MHGAALAVRHDRPERSRFPTAPDFSPPDSRCCDASEPRPAPGRRSVSGTMVAAMPGNPQQRAREDARETSMRSATARLVALGLLLSAPPIADAATAGMGGMMGAASGMMASIENALSVGSGTGGPDDGRGVACLPGGRRFMVSKVVDGERWMVTWDARMGMGLGDMSGNVVTDDGHVIFLHCTVTGVTGPDPEHDSLLMSCDAGDAVVGPSGWTHFDDVTLPATFFLP